MSDVKWIKISTNIFDDEKIALIEGLPKADSILVIWFKLLCLAGKTNNDGCFMLTDNIPYTNEMLSKIFRRKKSLVELAIKTFQEFGMIEIVDGVITIPKWNDHQSLQGFDKRKEYMREYMKERRSKQKNETCKPNSKVNSKPNINLLEEDKEKDKEVDKSKHIYGEYKNVKLTNQERDKLMSEYGEQETSEAIKYLDEYIEMKGYKAKSHYLAIRKWVFDAIHRDRPRQKTLADKWGLGNDT